MTSKEVIAAALKATGHTQAEAAAKMGWVGQQLSARLMRNSMRADELLDNRNEWAAMEEYRHILRMHQNSRLGMAFYGAVWNNLGVCYAKQFLFQEAADCFETSCEYAPDEEVERQADLARQLAGGEIPFPEGKKTEDALPQKKLLRWEKEYRMRQK